MHRLNPLVKLVQELHPVPACEELEHLGGASNPALQVRVRSRLTNSLETTRIKLVRPLLHQRLHDLVEFCVDVLGGDVVLVHLDTDTVVVGVRELQGVAGGRVDPASLIVALGREDQRDGAKVASVAAGGDVSRSVREAVDRSAIRYGHRRRVPFAVVDALEDELPFRHESLRQRHMVVAQGLLLVRRVFAHHTRPHGAQTPVLVIHPLLTRRRIAEDANGGLVAHVLGCVLPSKGKRHDGRRENAVNVNEDGDPVANVGLVGTTEFGSQGCAVVLEEGSESHGRDGDDCHGTVLGGDCVRVPERKHASRDFVGSGCPHVRANGLGPVQFHFVDIVSLFLGQDAGGLGKSREDGMSCLETHTAESNGVGGGLGVVDKEGRGKLVLIHALCVVCEDEGAVNCVEPQGNAGCACVEGVVDEFVEGILEGESKIEEVLQGTGR